MFSPKYVKYCLILQIEAVTGEVTEADQMIGVEEMREEDLMTTEEEYLCQTEDLVDFSLSIIRGQITSHRARQYKLIFVKHSLELLNYLLGLTHENFSFLASRFAL